MRNSKISYRSVLLGLVGWVAGSESSTAQSEQVIEKDGAIEDSDPSTQMVLPVPPRKRHFTTVANHFAFNAE